MVVAPFIIFLGTIGISILQSLNDDQTAYSHQTSHVFNGSNGKRFAQLQLLCKINHRLHYSVAGVDVWPQRDSDNLDQWTYYLLCSISFDERDAITQLRLSYECRRNFGRICSSFHCPWYIMCRLLWKTRSTGTCFCGRVGLICGRQSFYILFFQIQLGSIISFFTAYFTPVDHFKSCYGPCMDKGNSHKTWRSVVRHAICREDNSRYRRIVHLRKIWIKEYPFRKRWNGLDGL